MQHHTFLASSLFVTIFAATTACTSDGGADDAAVVGAARYGDAATDPNGGAREPARPPAQDAPLTLRIEGHAVLTGMAPSCADGLGGQFQALYQGHLAIGDDGAYAAGIGSAVASLTTPAGCTIPDLTVQVVTRVTAHAELTATTANCTSYCDASARARAESTCAGSSDQVSCRAEAEAGAQASCMTTCTREAHAIVAEASLGLDSLTSLDAAALRSAALGQLTADLTFDHLVDGSGQVLGD
jgi:hypothetical protein